MAKINKQEEVAIDLLKPYANNAKVHSKQQIKKIGESIFEFGFLSPCLIDMEYNVIAGHGRIEAAKSIGLSTVPCLFVEGLSEAQYKAYVLADNKLTELGDWDEAKIKEELETLKSLDFDISLTGFDLDNLVLNTGDVEELDIDDELEELVTEKTISKSGQIWLLGQHRLMVGDSTDKDDVFALMDGNEADLVITDPPYNVAVANADGLTIANDDMSEGEFSSFLDSAMAAAASVLKAGGVFYIWHADSNGLQFRQACVDNGLTIKQNLIWVKSRFTLGRQDYQWMHEPCLYGWKEGAGHYFQNARNIPTVVESIDNYENMSKEELVEIIRQLADDRTSVCHEQTPVADDLHPTMKPINLILRQIKNSSREGETVLDLFGGSGTTLLECEQLNRKCCMMEYDPKYADVIIRRWEEETGKKAEKIYG